MEVAERVRDLTDYGHDAEADHVMNEYLDDGEAEVVERQHRPVRHCSPLANHPGH